MPLQTSWLLQDLLVQSVYYILYAVCVLAIRSLVNLANHKQFTKVFGNFHIFHTIIYTLCSFTFTCVLALARLLGLLLTTHTAKFTASCSWQDIPSRVATLLAVELAVLPLLSDSFL